MTKTNEYILPKEKPFETVYEIKNEVPSFEEFMKTYENDGSVNYADLNSGDVGEVEGCGPCSSCRYSCSCPRSDCDCIYDEGAERWCVLRLRCPICPPGPSNTVSGWSHGSCPSYKVWISNKARIKCDKTRCRNEQIRYWNFVCSNHKGEPLSKNGSFTLAVLNVINAKEAAYGADEKLLTDLMLYLETHSWSQGY